MGYRRQVRRAEQLAYAQLGLVALLLYIWQRLRDYRDALASQAAELTAQAEWLEELAEEVEGERAELRALEAIAERLEPEN